MQNDMPMPESLEEAIRVITMKGRALDRIATDLSTHLGGPYPYPTQGDSPAANTDSLLNRAADAVEILDGALEALTRAALQVGMDPTVDRDAAPMPGEQVRVRLTGSIPTS